MRRSLGVFGELINTAHTLYNSGQSDSQCSVTLGSVVHLSHVLAPFVGISAFSQYRDAVSELSALHTRLFVST